MNDATQKIADGFKNLDEMLEKSSMAQKLIMKALAGFTVVMDSSLDRTVKFDAIKATFEMIIKSGEYHALNQLRKCNQETQAPIEFIHPIMALRAIDELRECELRFNTMMLLFVDEVNNRMRDG